MSEKREKVYCIECKHFHKSEIYETCESPYNKGNYLSRERIASTPSVINRNNNCQWYQEKG